MEKVKKIAALVAAILLPLFTIAGTVVAEIVLCKHNLWFVAVMYLYVFCFAVGPIYKVTAQLWNYALAAAKQTRPASSASTFKREGHGH